MDAGAQIAIRQARAEDFAALWPILRAVIRAGDTYTIEPDLSRDEMRAAWMDLPRATFVAEVAGEAVGSYTIRTNQPGGGAHVCNCAYMVAGPARGRGVARAMCLHSQTRAREMGYLAMQFNFVVETNAPAIALWEALGFETVGRLPRAFRHPVEGLVDARIMYKWLGE